MTEEEAVKKPSLVIVTDNFVPRRDGIVRFLEEIIPRLNQHFSITVIAPDYKHKNVDLPNIKTVRIPLSKRVVGDFRPAKIRPWRMYRTLKKADLVFTQTIGPIGGLGLFMAQKMRRKTVSFIHSLEWELFPTAVRKKYLKKHLPKFTRKLVRMLYSKCTAMIVPSERISDLLTWEKIMSPRRIIHLGVDTQDFKPYENAVERERKRDELGIKPNDKVIGYHGRISREKDVFTLVRAFVKLRRAHENLKLLIIGSGLPHLEKKLQKQEGVIYLAARDDVEDYLPLMDIYCLPSLTETTSLATLEAMSCELPVVCTPVGFVKDYVLPGKSGLFFKKKDSFSLMKQLETLIKNPKLCKEMGDYGRKLVVKNFDWDRTASRIEDYLKELL